MPRSRFILKPCTAECNSWMFDRDFESSVSWRTPQHALDDQRAASFAMNSTRAPRAQCQTGRSESAILAFWPVGSFVRMLVGAGVAGYRPHGGRAHGTPGARSWEVAEWNRVFSGRLSWMRRRSGTTSTAFSLLPRI